MGKTFVPRDGVLEDVRSTVVRLSTNRLSAFEYFQLGGLPEEYPCRVPVACGSGTVFNQGLKALAKANGEKRTWREKKYLQAKNVVVRTDRKSSRHRFKVGRHLSWRSCHR